MPTPEELLICESFDHASTKGSHKQFLRQICLLLSDADEALLIDRPDVAKSRITSVIQRINEQLKT